MRRRILVGVLAVIAASLTLSAAAHSGQSVGKKPIAPGTFAGGAVFFRPATSSAPGGSIWQTQYAQLVVKSVSPAETVAEVRWNFTVVPASTAPVCTHLLKQTKVLRKNLELAFDVTSTTGSCIANPKSYRISWLDRKRVVIELTYADGVTAAGLLRRK
jgi:hypothetical protein